MTTHAKLDLLSQFIEQGRQNNLVQVNRTLDGKHYLTHQHAEDAIMASIQQDRRITLTKLSETLSLEPSVIEDRLKTLSFQQWTRVDDLILTNDYVDMIQKEVIKSLQSNGCLSIMSQAQHLKLPYSLMKSIMTTENVVYHPTLSDLVTTEEYIEQSKSSIQSLLETLDEPYPIFKLQKSMAMPEDLFYLFLEQLVQKENGSLGTLRGKRSRAVFEPKQYRQRQLLIIQSIFDSNECITMDTIEGLYAFSNPIDMIQELYDKDAFVCLSSCIIKSTVQQKACKAVESMKEYFDINDVLPEELTFEDVSQVVENVMKEIQSSQRYTALDGGYVISVDYMDQLVQQSHHYLTNLSRQKTKLSDSEIVRAFETLGCPHHLAEKILPFRRTVMIKQYTELLKTPYRETGKMVSNDPWIREHKQLTLKKLTHLRHTIYFNYQSIQLFQDPTAKKSLEKYMLKIPCVEFLFYLVIYLVLDQSFNKAEVSQSSSLCIPLEDIEQQRIVDAKEQKWVITYFIRENDHKYDKTAVIEIEELLKKKDLVLFITHMLVQDKYRLFQEPIDTDKATEAANTMIRTQLRQQLKQLSIVSSPELLHLVSLLLFQQTFQMPLYVSGKFVPAILQQLKPLLAQEQQDLLTVTHLAIIHHQQENHQKEFRQLYQLGQTL